MPLPAPDPTVLHPIAGQQRVVFLRALVQSPNIEVGEYTYYDSYGDPLAFEREAVLYAFGPERLIIGRFCAIASGVRFLMPGANHADRGPSTFPFGVFGPPWDDTMDLVMSAPSRGDTVIGHDVWLGTRRSCCPAWRSATARSSRRQASSPATSPRMRSSPETPPCLCAPASRRRTSSVSCGPRGGTGRSSSSPSTHERSWPVARRSWSASPPSGVWPSRRADQGAGPLDQATCAVMLSAARARATDTRWWPSRVA